MKKWIFYVGMVFWAIQINAQTRENTTSFFENANTSSSEYITTIEGAIQRLSVLQRSSVIDSKIKNINNNLPNSDTTIKVLKQSLKYENRLDIRDLQMFQDMVSDIQANLKSYKDDLDSLDNKIEAATIQLSVIRNDSVLKLLLKDTVAKKQFYNELKQLKIKWTTTDSILKSNKKLVEKFIIHVENNTIANSQLVDLLNSMIAKIAGQCLKKEQNYLWEKNTTQIPDQDYLTSGKAYYASQKEALAFYIKDSFVPRILMLLVGLLFYVWTYRNYRSIEKANNPNLISSLDLGYISKYPVIPSLIFVLNISPFFDLMPPAIYIDFMQFLLVVVLTWVFYKQKNSNLFINWICLVVLFTLVSATHLVSTLNYWIRYLFLILTIISTCFGFYFLRFEKLDSTFPKYVQWATLIFIVFNCLSMLLNLFGRWTLSQLFGSASIFSLTQAIALSIFIQICTEAFTLNIQQTRIKNNLKEDFDFTPFIKTIQKAFNLTAIILWVMVLGSNLNVYKYLYQSIMRFLTSPRSMGSITFNLGSIVLFFLIIWLSSTLQKYISYLFGDTGEEISKANKRQHSKLLLVRLILLTAGFFLAVAASGLPVDKITFIIGALGVGIGLGLQNIVNNFVSGVILIFEKPFQVGDTIEIGPRKGIVKEIGIRHSLLLTPEGGEVIVPNGDMLSNQIINWTLSNDYIRIEIPLKVEAKENWSTVNNLIKEAIAAEPRVLTSVEPIILLNSITNDIIDFKALVWCNEIHYADRMKSDLTESIFESFKNKNIQVK